MAAGVWVSIAVTVFWLSIGIIIYIFQRDKARRQREREARERPVKYSNPNAASVKELEKQFGRKG